jgi:hypothetical protein
MSERLHIHTGTDRCVLRHCGWSGFHFHWRHRRHRSAFDGSLTEQEITEFDAACAAQSPRPGRDA